MLVLSPRLTRVDGDPSAYLGVFSREKTPLDRLFEGERLFLNPPETTIGFPATRVRLLLEAALRWAGLQPVGGRASGPKGLRVGRPRADLAWAELPPLRVRVWRSASRRAGVSLRMIGSAVSGGTLFVSRWVANPLTNWISRPGVRRALAPSAIVRRLAALESVGKAVALSSLVSLIAPSVAGPAALLTPLGLLILSVATLTLTTLWMGSHALVDAVRSVVTGQDYERDWRTMWTGALALNAAGVAAVVAAAILGLLVGPVTPEAAYGLAHGAFHVIANAVLPATAALSLAAAEKSDWRKQPNAVEWIDGDFRGVDLQHFAHAQMRLAKGLLDPDRTKAGPGTLAGVLSALGIPRTGDAAADHAAIAEALADGRYDARIIDFINADPRDPATSTYADPELQETIGLQNKNPFTQSVYEAVSNSLDAMGLEIGQFGKGVKQALDWMEWGGNRGRVEVVTRTAPGRALMLTIRPDAEGRLFIQIQRVSDREFAARAGAMPSGTSLRIVPGRKIPATASTGRDSLVSQEGILSGIRRRYPFITRVNIALRQAGRSLGIVNGFEHKGVIVPPGVEITHAPPEKTVTVSVDDDAITIVDPGRGMSGRVLGRMFVPGLTTKAPEVLDGDAVDAQLKRVQLVRDSSLPNQFSFARNGEVVFTVDLPGSITPRAAISGTVMIDVGRLISVPEGRDNVNLPRPKRGEPTIFSRGVMRVVELLLELPTLTPEERAANPKRSGLTVEEKLAYVNTIAIGLDGLIANNTLNEEAVLAIREEMRRAIAPLLEREMAAGLLVLPHEAAYEKLDVSKVPRVVFLHPGLFTLSWADGLRALGGEEVPDVQLGGDRALPLVIVPFRADVVARARTFHRTWNAWPENERLPVVATKRFVAIPPELGSRFLQLAKLRQAGNLAEPQQREYDSLLRRINILTSEAVDTGYQVATRKKKNVTVRLRTVNRERGRRRSWTNQFLVQPPVEATSARLTDFPPDARVHYEVVDGRLFDLRTGNALPDLGDDTSILTPLYGNYVHLSDLFEFDDTEVRTGVYQLQGDTWVRAAPAGYSQPSENRRYALRTEQDAWWGFDSRTGQEFEVGTDAVFANGGQCIVGIEHRANGDRVKITQGPGAMLSVPLPPGTFEIPAQRDGRWIRIVQKGPTGKTFVIDSVTGDVKGPVSTVDRFGRYLVARGPDGWKVELVDGRVVTEASVGFPIIAFYLYSTGDLEVVGEGGRKMTLRLGTLERIDHGFAPSVTDRVPSLISAVVFEEGVALDQVSQGELVVANTGVAVVGNASASDAFEIHTPNGEAIPTRFRVADYQVRFDGPYAVFSPKKTGTVWLVDTAAPLPAGSASRYREIPVEVAAGETSATDTRPPDLGDAAIVVRESAKTGTRFVIVTSNGHRHVLPNDILGGWRIGPNLFRVRGPLPDMVYYVNERGELVYEPRIDPDVPTIGHFAVLKLPNGRRTLLNLKTGEEGEPYEQLEIGPSRHYAVARHQGEILVMFWDGTKMTLVKRFAQLKGASTPAEAAAIASYEFSPTVDAFEVVDRAGNARTVMLGGGNVFISELRLVELIVDDAGLFAIAPATPRLSGKGFVFSFVTGKTELWDPTNGDIVVSADDKKAYLRIPGKPSATAVGAGKTTVPPWETERIFVFDRKARTTTAAGASTPWPPFGRSYSGSGESAVVVENGRPLGGTVGQQRRFPTADERPDRPDRKRLAGNFIVMGHRVTALDNLAAGHPAVNDLDARDSRHLAKHRLLFGPGHYYEIPPDGLPIRHAHDLGPYATEDGQQVMVHGAGGWVLYSNGEPRDVNDEIPPGYQPAAVIGNVFVFSDAKGDPLYLRFPVETTAGSNEPALRAWDQDVLSRWDALADQVDGALQPLTDAIPKEFQSDVDAVVDRNFAPVAQKDEREIGRRFGAALAAGKPVDLETPLPSARVRARAERLAADLAPVLDWMERNFRQDDESDRLAMVRHLFDAVLDLARSDVSLDALDPTVLRALVFGFRISTSEDVEDARALGELLDALTDSRARGPVLTKVGVFMNESFKRAEDRQVLRRQVRRVAAIALPVREKLVAAFAPVDLETALLPYAQGNLSAAWSLGDARPFVLFLTRPIKFMPRREYAPDELQGVDLDIAGGLSLAVVQVLEEERPKNTAPRPDLKNEREVMTVDYFVDRIADTRRGRPLPPVTPEQAAKLRSDVTTQRESGAYASELVQKSVVGTRGQADGELDIRFYTRLRNGREESVEEVSDNGAGALQPMSLNVASPAFRDVDHVERITRNDRESYLFEYDVIRQPQTGEVVDVRLTRVRKLTDARVRRGVTTRLIRTMSSTIPELDQLISMRNWKVVAGLSQTDGFKVTVPAEDGNGREPLVVDHEVMASARFVDRNGHDWGEMRLIATKDMPMLVRSELGLPVKPVPAEYLALVPAPLRAYAEEMGINIQIPLPLIRQQTDFGHEDAALIQQYVAMLFYQALARRLLSETSPQFIFDGYPDDFETRPAYSKLFGPGRDPDLVALAIAINAGRLDQASRTTLDSLLVPEGGELDTIERYTRLIVQLKVRVRAQSGGETMVSALERRDAVQQKIGFKQSMAVLEALGQGASKDTYVPNAAEKIHQAQDFKKLIGLNWDDYAYVPSSPEDEQRRDWLRQFGLNLAAPFGLTDVRIVASRPNDTLPFAGCFLAGVMYLNIDSVATFQKIEASAATNVIVHELAHWLEAIAEGRDGGFVIDLNGFTHQAKGFFGSAMKYVSAVSLANHDPDVFQATNIELLRRVINFFLRPFGLSMSRGWYNAVGAWVAEGVVLAAVGGAAFLLFPGLDFRALYNIAWIAFPLLHVTDLTFQAGRRGVGTRIAMATALAAIMLVMPAMLSPDLLVLLSFGVHALFNNAMAGAAGLYVRVRQNGFLSLVRPRPVARRLQPEPPREAAERVARALARFAGGAARAGLVNAGEARVLTRALAAVPDGRVLVSEIAGPAGRVGFRSLLETPNFSESDFVTALSEAVKTEIAEGTLAPQDVLPLLRELADERVPLEGLADVVAAALRRGDKYTIVIDGDTDETRVNDLLLLLGRQLRHAAVDRGVTVEIVVPGGSAARKRELEAVANRWLAGLRFSGRPRGLDTVSLVDPPGGLIRNGTLDLVRLSSVVSLRNTTLMVPRGVVVDTDGLPADVLRSLMVATIQDAISARTMSAEAVANLARVAQIIARQA